MTYNDETGLTSESHDPHHTVGPSNPDIVNSSHTNTVQYEVPPDQSVTTGLMHVIDAGTDVDLTRTETMLADAVDTDALDALFPPGATGDTRVEFEHWGCVISITSDRLITVSDHN